MEAEAEVQRKPEEIEAIKEADHQEVLLRVEKDLQAPLHQDLNLEATRTKRDQDRPLLMMFLLNKIQTLNEDK